MPGGDGVFLQVDDAVHIALFDVADAVVFEQVWARSVVDEGLQKLAHVHHHAQSAFEYREGGEVVVLAQCVEHILQGE